MVAPHDTVKQYSGSGELFQEAVDGGDGVLDPLTLPQRGVRRGSATALLLLHPTCQRHRHFRGGLKVRCDTSDT